MNKSFQCNLRASAVGLASISTLHCADETVRALGLPHHASVQLLLNSLPSSPLVLNFTISCFHSCFRLFLVKIRRVSCLECVRFRFKLHRYHKDGDNTKQLTFFQHLSFSPTKTYIFHTKQRLESNKSLMGT